MPLDQAEANRLLNAMLGKAAYTAPTAPMRGRLMSANGSASANGTEVVNAGGSAYTAQDVSAALPASGTNGVITNTSAITYTNMPAITTVGIEVWDSAGTPRRALYGSLTASKTTALGDSLTIAPSALVLNMV